MSDSTAALVINVESNQVDKAKRSLADLANQGGKTEASLNGIATASTNTNTQVGSLVGGIKGLIGAYAGLAGARAIGGAIDTFTKYNAQLKLSTNSQAEFNQALGDVSRIANTSQSSIASVATLYARLNTSLKDLGTSQETVAKIAENVGLALKVSGATAAESSSAILQLSQAFGSGVLRGEEFNAVNEAAPILMRELAKSMGVPVGALRELASEGKITSDVLTKAFGNDDLLNRFREQGKEVQTLSGGIQVLGNKLLEAIGAIDQTTGASKALSKVLVFLGENIGIVVGVVIALGAALVALAAPSIIAGAIAIGALFTGPVGIAVLIAAATGAAVTFGIQASNSFAKAAAEARKLKNALADKGNGAPVDFAGLKEYRAIEDAEKRLALLKRGNFVIYSKEGAKTSKQAAIELEKEIKLRKAALGINRQNIQPANGNQESVTIRDLIQPRLFKPIERKAGQGGYDASLNNQAQIDAAEKAAFRTSRASRKSVETADTRLRDDARKAETKRRLGALELELNTEVLFLDKKLDVIESNSKSKELLRKKFAKLDEENNKTIQRSADKRFSEELRLVKSAEEEKRREFEKTVDGIDETFREGFAALINGGKGSWKSFTQSLVTTFKTTVADQIYKMFLQPFIVKIAASFAGLGGAGGAGGLLSSLGGGLSGVLDKITGKAGAGGGGFGDILGTVKSLFKGGNDAIIGGISKFGASLTNSLGGIGDKIGGFIGTNSALIGKLAPFAGAAFALLKGDVKGAAGAGLGAALSFTPLGPIGGAIGALLGGKLFGAKKKQPPRQAGNASASFIDGVLTSSQSKLAGRNKTNAGLAGGVENALGAFTSSLGGLLKAFGGKGNVSASGFFTGRDKGSSYFGLNSTADGVNTKFNGREKKGFGEASFAAFIERLLGVELVKAIQASKITSGIKDLFTGLADKTVIAGLILATSNLNAQEMQLNKQFGLTVDVAGKVIKASGAAGQGLVDFANKLTLIAQSSLSVGDVLTSSRANISTALSEAYSDVITEAVTSTVTRQVPIDAPKAKFSPAKNLKALGLFGGNQAGGLFAAIGKQFISTVPQQFKTVTEQVTTFVDRLINKAVDLPKSLADFDKLIKSVNTSTAGGQKQVADLFQLRDAFSAYTQAIDGLKANVKGSIFEFRDAGTQSHLLNVELHSLANQLGVAVPKSVDDLIKLADSIDFTTEQGINLAAGFGNLTAAFTAANPAIEAVTETIKELVDIAGLKKGVFDSTLEFRAPEEKRKLLQAYYESLFKEIGIAAPKSKTEFLKLADSIDLSSKFGQDLAAKLPELASAFGNTELAVDKLVESLERGADSFTNQVDASRYFGVSKNFGNEFANDYTYNVEQGRVKNGMAIDSGASNDALIAEVKALRQATEVQAVDISKLVRYQIKIDELGTKVAA